MGGTAFGFFIEIQADRLSRSPLTSKNDGCRAECGFLEVQALERRDTVCEGPGRAEGTLSMESASPAEIKAIPAPGRLRFSGSLSGRPDSMSIPPPPSRLGRADCPTMGHFLRLFRSAPLDDSSPAALSGSDSLL